MINRDALDNVTPQQLADPVVRKQIFREFGRDLSMSIREKAITDTPGSIARLMEKAYRLGLDNANLEMTVPPVTGAKIGEMHLTPTTRKHLGNLRLYIRPGKDFDPKACWFFTLDSERDPVFAAFGAVHSFRASCVSELEKYGLAITLEASPGRKVGYITEWGLELLMTGETSAISSRNHGESSQYSSYAATQTEGVAEAALGVCIALDPKRKEPTAQEIADKIMQSRRRTF